MKKYIMLSMGILYTGILYTGLGFASSDSLVFKVPEYQKITEYDTQGAVICKQNADTVTCTGGTGIYNSPSQAGAYISFFHTDDINYQCVYTVLVNLDSKANKYVFTSVTRGYDVGMHCQENGSLNEPWLINY